MHHSTFTLTWSRDPSLRRTRFSVGVTVLTVFAIAVLTNNKAANAQLIDWSNTSNVDSYYHFGNNWIGNTAPASGETANFNQGATYQVWWDANTAGLTPDVGMLNILQGDVTFLNVDGSAQHQLTINGSGGAGAFSDFSISGAGTSLTNGGMHLRSLGGGEILGGATLTLDGSHLQGARLTVDGTTGFDVSGSLNIEAGGIFDNTKGYIGYQSGSTGTATVTGAGSQWNNSGNVYAGYEGNGTLHVQDNGYVNSSTGIIGYQTGSSGMATVTGTNSRWENAGNLYTGYLGDGTLNIADGGLVSNWRGDIGDSSGSSGMATVTGTNSRWENAADLNVGTSGNGTLNIEAGGQVTNIFGHVGRFNGSMGIANVTGTNSRWENASGLRVGSAGNGTLNVADGGLVSNLSGFIGFQTGSSGMATVTGTNSRWENAGNLFAGNEGTGTLNISGGGMVSNSNGFIGRFSGSTGSVEVTDNNSQWNNSNDLYIGGDSANAGGTATLDILNNGLVSVVGTTRIWSGSTVNLAGGRFEFGQTSLQEFQSINATSGSLAGNVLHSGTTDLSTLTSLMPTANANVSDVTLVNNGTLMGSANIGTSLNNQPAGELIITSGQQVLFDGGLSNMGALNNDGGSARFQGTAINMSGAMVSGHGVFEAESGWTNDGTIVMSSGIAEIHGDLINSDSGIITINGGSTATFYDDVIMDADNMNIEVASGSNSIFLGSYNGGSDGTGTVQALGELRPGNSSAIVNFGGDLEMGVNTASYIELAGLNAGEFDQLLVAGDMSVDGQLNVSLIDGFNLGFNQEFLIADIGGMRTGFFDGLGEGDLVGNFGGMDLFISYSAGSGNDVALFTAVPEPGTAGLLSCVMLALAMRRRRRQG